MSSLLMNKAQWHVWTKIQILTSVYVYMDTNNRDKGPIRLKMNTSIEIFWSDWVHSERNFIPKETLIIIPNNVHIHTRSDPVFLIGVKWSQLVMFAASAWRVSNFAAIFQMIYAN